MERSRARLFLAITLLVPVVMLGAVEGVLRLTWKGGAMPLFVPAPNSDGELLIANPRVARRWFPAESQPPAPVPDAFTAKRAPNSIRVFAMGESSTAGFPWPRNGAFPRLVRDALRDVYPGDSVEVINLGIPATSSYAMLDEAREVIAQHPDAVLIYAGHNEYYGALASGSTVQLGSSPALVRTYLSLQRLRLVLALRNAIVAVRRGLAPPPRGQAATASFMETVARDQNITSGSAAYRAGVSQFEGNLGALVSRLRAAGIAVFVASPASNERDRAPFSAEGNAAPGGANAIYADARAHWEHGDSALARAGFANARDADVIRFRAPSEFVGVAQRVAQASGAVYVPVAERFAAASPAGSPGASLFLEHVHPTQHGTALIAQSFVEAMLASKMLKERAYPERLRPWTSYEQGMELSAFDERIVHHTVQTITTRWPFVPASAQADYRGSYHPVGDADSLALLVSRGGMTWESAKLQLALRMERDGHADSALAEYRGLARDLPGAPLVWVGIGRTLQATGHADAADSALSRAYSLEPSSELANGVANAALKQKDYARAIPWLQRVVQSRPGDAGALYNLSLSYALTKDLEGARSTAARLAQVAPGYPGLAGWMAALGMK